MERGAHLMPVAVGDLIAQLSAADAAARRVAAERLGQLGEAAQSAAAALVQCLRDTDEEVREAVTSALESIGPPAKAQLAELTQLVKDDSADVAYWAATMLGRLQAAAGSATEALAGCLDDARDLAVRERAAWALGEIGTNAKTALEQLKQAAASSHARLARLAQSAIDRIAP